MLFQVEMDVNIPPGFDPEEAATLKAAEKVRFQELQKAGTWRHIWRVVGRYANLSIFDVPDNATLHELLTTLPLYPFMTVRVTPLCRHPSSAHADDR
ncbi:muconolactone Delta-isomerase [Acidocella aminolytica]|uniref:Muconolactone Delta-isomerase n=1 Tax=Acidocella aminolytica 101 = DSM 11237 TaxID=1120923 RepID=A0A0D6PDX3_9PROT|nr:muconolactone Delta-isomerase [Acidocella aminolytica]GAN79862.1 muconolactone isomerase [Acidocella aminolytica 101 = DSM 11237]GBQ38827.1 muconolactone delta-isomerase [Acidocella aminolytica 101 = DSM 11237]SHE61139.1 muconolactone D-isomerase [Acidocella aminolytica 101 = DSM 11237]